MLEGLGANASGSYKEIVKNCKAMLSDKALLVRVASASCLQALAAQSNILHAELDGCVLSCVKGFEDSDYPTRQAIAQFLGYLLATAQTAPATPSMPYISPIINHSNLPSFKAADADGSVCAVVRSARQRRAV
jgi:HEAT repeat protein